MRERGKLTEVIKVFFKLGLIAFGGPAAHIAMMEEEVVNKRKWMSRQHFLDLMGATNLIPGPNSTEMTMHCGYERAGYPGLFAAGISFIFPAVVLTGFLGFLYVEYGTLPQVEPFLYGIKPAVLAIIAGAVLKLGKKALKNATLGVLGALVVVAAFLGLNEIAAILGAGVLAIIWFGIKNKQGSAKSWLPVMYISTANIVMPTAISTSKIFWVFLKVGSVLFGSGYVLVAYLDGELVQKLHWLTEQQLLDAIAIGQFTPGPVLSTATFVGYQLNGVAGALAATAGIFLPSFVFVMLLNPLVNRLRKSKATAYFLDGVNIGAVGIMLAVLLQMTESIVIDWRAAVIALIGALAVFGPKKISSLYIVLGGAVLGYLLSLL